MIKRCKGCGIELQDKDKNLLGYIDNLEKNICERCFKLSNYGEYQKVSLTNEDYKKIINSIDKNKLVVYITDIIDLNLDYINKFNKVLLVVTKRDTLPKSIKDEKIIKYLKEQYKNVVDIIIISSIHNYNLDNLYNTILKYNNNKEIYIVGATNSGKSTLINKLIKNYSNIEEKVTTSMYPSTTLDKVVIKLEDLTLIDTPGLIIKGNIMNNLSKQDLKKIISKKEIKPKTCQIQETGSILIDNFVRIDYETKTKNSMTFYMSNNLNIKFNSYKNNNLKELSIKEFQLEENKDLVIKGLGFIKFTKPINLKIYIDKDIDLFIRNNLI